VRAFDSTPAQIGQEALARVGASDLEAARQWLDWARQLYPPDISAEDQPYLAFAMLWAPGQRADAETTRRAAATLAVQAKSGTDAVKIVEEAVRKARSDVERRRYELALLPAFVAADRWSEFHDGARKVIERQPRSTKAFSMAMMALARQRKFDAAEELARARLRLIPNDPQALMELATTMSSKGDFERAEQFGRKALVAGDKSGIYNNLAWYSLFRRGGVTPAALEDARRASELDPESGAITHTLATLYAEIGQVTEAHELLAKLMAKNKTAPPDPSAFYVHARVAEHLGLTEVATDSYRRAMGEPQKDGWEHPESVRTLAMSQLKRMKAPMVAVPTP
jgi:tetratricopeptide (TPR) repeat protein